MSVESAGMVSGLISSSDGPVWILSGDFQGEARAASDLTLDATSVCGTLTAGGQLSVLSYTDVAGTLHSTGGDVKVEAAGAVIGSVTASGNVTIYAGDVAADVASSTGSVEIFAEGRFSGTALATVGGVV